MITSLLRHTAILLLTCLLTACGFHLRGDLPLATPLHSLYIQSNDPYGTLVKELEQSLKMSRVTLVENESEAKTVFVLLKDATAQDLLSVSGTQQTRQYRLSVTVVFEIKDHSGRTIVPPQTLAESRVITVQSNQILGSSNEANLYFQQMRRTLASSILYRLSSREISQMVNQSSPAASTPLNPKAKHTS